MVTCSDEGVEADLADVGGLDFEDVDILTQTLSLDPFVPIIPRGLFGLSSDDISATVVGVVLNDVLTKKGRSRHGQYYLPQDTRIDTDLLQNPVFQGKEVILFSCGQDIIIETLWWDRDGLNLFRDMARVGFLAVTGMNFSLFVGECPFGHALNMKKSLCYCRELASVGAQTIPHMYALNDHQRERWQSWLVARPHIGLVTINTQLQRGSRRDMDEVVKTARYLLENTEVSILLQGRGTGLPKDLLRRYAGRLHVAASGPLKRAAIRKDKTPDEHIEEFESRLGLGTKKPPLTPGVFTVQLLTDVSSHFESQKKPLF